MESNMDLLKEHEALLQEHRESTRAVNEEALQTPRSGAAPRAERAWRGACCPEAAGGEGLWSPLQQQQNPKSQNFKIKREIL